MGTPGRFRLEPAGIELAVEELLPAA